MPVEIGFPGEIGHNNTVRAVVDGNFVRGGIRRVADLDALYGLSSLANVTYGQIAQYRTLVWVDSEASFYQLMDISQAGNVDGWSKLSTSSDAEITAYIENGILYINEVAAGNVGGEPGVGITSIVDNNNGTFTITLSDESTYDVATIQGEPGDNGASAYEVWQSIEGNESGTLEDFISAITGADGAPGAPGASGAPGDDGNTVLSGSGVPINSLGSDGDFYIDTSTSSIYGPKSTTWGSAISLIGPPGENGEDGVTPTVTVTPAVTTLPSGSSASVAVIPTANGINLAFSVPRGADGEDGEPGVGIESASVQSGSGDLLITLTDGNNINAGLVVGADGEPGEDGNSVLSGIGAPNQSTGNPGDFYIDTQASEIYGPKIDENWGSATSLVGPQGEPGEPGEDGSPFLEQELDFSVESTVSAWYSRIKNYSFDTTNTAEDILRALFSIYISNTINTFFGATQVQSAPGSPTFVSGPSTSASSTAYIEYGRDCKILSITYRTNTSSEITGTVKIGSAVQSLEEEIVASIVNNLVALTNPYLVNTEAAYTALTLDITDTFSSSTSSSTDSVKRFYKPYVFGSLNFEADTAFDFQALLDDVFDGTSANFLDSFSNTDPPTAGLSFTASGDVATDNYFVYIIYPSVWGNIVGIQRGNETATTDFLLLGDFPLENKWSSSTSYKVYRSLLGKPFNESELVTITFP